MRITYRQGILNCTVEQRPSVSITSVNSRLMLNQYIYYVNVALFSCNKERRRTTRQFRVYVRLILKQYIYYIKVAIVSCNVKRRPSVSITGVYVRLILNNTFTTSTWPLQAAMESGVAPSIYVLFTST